MNTVLFTWEMSSAGDHMDRLRLVADGLTERGARPVFAVRDVIAARRIMPGADVSILQAPLWPGPAALPNRPFGISSYADILAARGFVDADGLGAMVDAWYDLFELVRPDLIVADHSPTVCLAAFGRIPLVLVGTGYTLPPADLAEFPTIRPEIPPAATQAYLFDVMRTVQQRRGRPAPDTLPALFDAGLRAVSTLPELDPYRQYRSEALLAPLSTMPGRTPPPEKPAVYAHCAVNHPAFQAVVTALSELDMPRHVAFQGQAAAAPFLRSRGANVYETPPPLNEILPHVSAVISHGRPDISQACLFCGRPQVILPFGHEASLIGDRMSAFGTSIVIGNNARATDISSALERILEERRFRDLPEIIATTLDSRQHGTALPTVLDGCDRQLSARRARI